MTVSLDRESSRKLRGMLSDIGALHQGTDDGGGVIACRCGDRLASFVEWDAHVVKIKANWSRAAFAVDPTSVYFDSAGFAWALGPFERAATAATNQDGGEPPMTKDGGT